MLSIKKLSKEDIEKIIQFLISKNFSKLSVNSVWEFARFEKDRATVVIYHKKDSSFSITTNSQELLEKFHSILNFPSIQAQPNQPLQQKYNFTIGVDEAGKGELFGSIWQVAIVNCKLSPSEIANTKSGKRSINFWRKQFFTILNNSQLVVANRILPAKLVIGNYNTILTFEVYNLIKNVSKLLPKNSSRIFVIDDFGINKKRITIPDSKLLIEKKADEKFAEVKAASVVAKYLREIELDIINRHFRLKDNNQIINPGSGNLANPQTKRWITTWRKSHHSLPWFVKPNFKIY